MLHYSWRVIGFAVLAAQAHGQVYNWASAADGNWSDSVRWTPTGVPDGPGESAELGLSGSYLVSLGFNPSIDGLSLSNTAAMLQVEPGRVLGVGSGGILNDGVVYVNIPGSSTNTKLELFAGGTIGGTGEIILRRSTADLFDAWLTESGGSGFTHADGHTISGSGLVSGVIANDGVIVATDPAFALQVEGTITQSSTGVLRGDGAMLGVHIVSVTGGLVEGINGGVVSTVGNGAVLSNLTVRGAAAVAGGDVLTIAAPGIANFGVLTINPAGLSSNSTLVLNAGSAVVGPGEIVMIRTTADPFDAQLSTSGVSATLGASQTVRGSGLVRGDFVNNGLMLADDPAQPLEFDGVVTQGPLGRIKADGATALLTNVTVVGGEIASANLGLVDVSWAKTATLDGVTNTGSAGVRGGGTMALAAGGLTNNGVITVNSLGDSGNAALRFSADALLGGTGSVVLNQTTSDLFDAVLTTAAGVTGEIGPGQTITGRGFITGDFVSRGIILADVPGTDLRAAGNYDQTSGGAMRGDGAFVGLDDGLVMGGTFEGINGGRVDVVSGGLTTVSGVTMTGENGVRGGGLMALAGAVHNDGLLIVNSLGDNGNATLGAGADATLDGVGEVRLNQTTNDTLDAAIDSGAFTITIGADQTVSGHGRLGGDIVCTGTVTPGVGGPSSIYAVGSLTLAGTNTYKVEVGDADFDSIGGTASVSLDGMLEVSYLGAYAPVFGDSFPIVVGSAVSGSFGTVDAPPPPGSWSWRVRYDSDKAVLVVSCPADINIDGVINTIDFLAFLNLWTVGDLGADWNGDGTINTLDFIAYLNDWVAGC